MVNPLSKAHNTPMQTALIPASVWQSFLTAATLSDNCVFDSSFQEEMWDTIAGLEYLQGVHVIGEGAFRRAFSVTCEDGVERVVKLELNYSRTSNEQERKIWAAVRNTPIGQHFYGLYPESGITTRLVVQDFAEVVNSDNELEMYSRNSTKFYGIMKRYGIYAQDFRFGANAHWDNDLIRVFDYGNFRMIKD